MAGAFHGRGHGGANCDRRTRTRKGHRTRQTGLIGLRHHGERFAPRARDLRRAPLCRCSRTGNRAGAKPDRRSDPGDDRPARRGANRGRPALQLRLRGTRSSGAAALGRPGPVRDCPNRHRRRSHCGGNALAAHRVRWCSCAAALPTSGLSRHPGQEQRHKIRHSMCSPGRLVAIAAMRFGWRRASRRPAWRRSGRRRSAPAGRSGCSRHGWCRAGRARRPA